MTEAAPIFIYIPGKPTGKARPRFSKHSVYTPERTRVKEREIAQLAQVSMIGRKPFTGAVSVRIIAWMPGARTSKPDADNVSKLILDACNGIVWTDDRNVVDLQVRKISGSPAQTVVEIEGT